MVYASILLKYNELNFYELQKQQHETFLVVLRKTWSHCICIRYGNDDGSFFSWYFVVVHCSEKKGKANILSENGEKASDDEWLELTYLDIYECVCVFFFLFFVNWSTYAKCFIKEGSLK